MLLFRAAWRVPADAVHPVGPLLDVTVGTAVGALALGWAVDPGFALAPTWPGHGWLLAVALAGVRLVNVFGSVRVTPRTTSSAP